MRSAQCHPERKHFGGGFCSSCYHKDWRSRNPQKVKTLRENYYSNNKARLDAKSAEWRANHPERTKDFYRKSVFGLDAETYRTRMAQQQHRCAVCRRKFGNKFRPHVDHNHGTGEFRGLLCRDCNLMLGYARDRMVILLRAVRYLGKYRTNIGNA